MTAIGEVRDPYLSTDSRNEAIRALEAAALWLYEVERDSYNWKWAILAIHNALQGFMVLALTGSTNWGALADRDVSEKIQAEFAFRNASASGDKAAAERANQIMLFGGSNLASFLTLYKRIKSDDWWMIKFTNSRKFEPRSTDDLCISNLEQIRNEFAHFVPKTRGFLLTQFPAMTETALHIIYFLVRESGNIRFIDQDEEARFSEAFNSAQVALDQIKQSYVGLPLPAAGLCGAPTD